MLETPNKFDWWGSLRHGGLLIAPSKLPEFFAEPPAQLPEWLEERLRRDVTRLEVEDGPAALLDTVLERVLELGNRPDGSAGEWLKGSALSAEWTRRSVTGEALRPRRVWRGPNGALLPVFFDDQGRRLGIGRGRRAAARVVEWLRRTEQRVALLTNARQWRLLYAGMDYEAWAEWDTDLWFQEGVAGPQVDALRALLSRSSLVPPREGEPARLHAAIEASRKGQAELSAVLGERVRQAVELLIREYGEALADLDVAPRDIYRAATRVVMRMVVLLFAEALELLPRENAVYHACYGLQGLREALDRVGGSAAAERLRSRPPSAWPRVLALFRLVHQGSPHEAMPVRRYGGVLFEPGDPTSPDPIRRALAVLEDPTRARIPTDAAVRHVLELLTRTRVKVRQGRSSTWVPTAVDFADLSSEYIGILYEGLLDFELRHVTEGDPVVFLALGDEPALPLSRLEAMDDAALKSLLEKLKKPAKSESSSEEEEVEEEEDDEPETDGDESEEEPEPAEGDAEELEDDARRAARARAEAWALRAVEAGKLVKKPTSRRPEALEQYVAARRTAAASLVRRVVLPGEWYLVRFGGTRKGSGTFYTRPQLAVPTVRRTLQPLAYTPPLGADGKPDEDAPAGEWTAKAPGEILNLKVCDPACGSGSFLIATLRYMSEALWESLLQHGWLRESGDRLEVTASEESRPPWFAECVRDMPVDAEDAARRVRARLRRYVVEHCVYGVDMDDLAVDLCRVALWVETMNRELPFTFLDHKVKCGNSLVGCWFDRFQDYPALAWDREGGDKTHTNGVHFEKEAWTKAIKAYRNDRVKPALVAWIAGIARQGQLFAPEGQAPETVHDDAVKLFERLHAIDVSDPDEKSRFFREAIEGSAALRSLRQAFDRWCAVWFWPADRLEDAPLPGSFHAPAGETARITEELRRRHGFFHWELEFPDVFQAPASGFHASVGNPPWDIQKPNSKEFFSNLDPLYRTYGKQEALRRQTELFAAREQDERAWVEYNAGFKASSNWVKNAAYPFGSGEDESGKFALARGPQNQEFHAMWARHRARRTGYADPAHPFRHQGSADLNSYKLFLEQAYRVLGSSGQVGLIVPSGVYTDKGTSGLRELFLDRSRWRWLFGFENRDGIFPDVDGRFKFCPVIVEKGGRTDSVRTAFMQRELRTWEEPERHAIPYAREQVLRFSPNTRAILELRTRRDLEIVEKIYANSVLLGDQGPDGWGIKYSTEFHMTNDSKLFPPRPKWEEKGYRPDEYSRWLLGKWRKREPGCPAPPDAARWEVPPGVILSRDEHDWIHEQEIHDTALPLYQGVMIWQYDFSAARFAGGSGLQADWNQTPLDNKLVDSQYLISTQDVLARREHLPAIRIAFRDIQNATNQRTFIGALIPAFPCGNTVPTFESSTRRLTDLLPSLNSFPLDRILRLKMSQNHVNWFYAEELPVPIASNNNLGPLSHGALSLCATSPLYAEKWTALRRQERPWRRLWALTPHERLRLRCHLDAIVAEQFGLEWEDLAWILVDCDHPRNRTSQNTFTRGLDPKSFWRVDKDREPELRHTVLTLAAFRDLKETIRAAGSREAGIQSFCSQNDGEGWMLPETLRLSDLGLGRDDRARKAQPVRERMGERFFPSQLEQSVEASWAECELHARNLLGELEYRRLKGGIEGAEGTTDRRLGAPLLSGASRAADRLRNRQGILFDDLEPERRQGKLWD